MLKSIAQLDPAAIGEALRREQRLLAGEQSELDGAIGEEAIAMAERSAAFLKLAAPELPPALVQYAIDRNAVRLFDPRLDAEGFQAAAEVIAQVKANQALINDCFLMPPDQRDALHEQARALGWAPGSLRSDIGDDPVAPMWLVRGVRPPSLERDPLARPVDADARSLAAKDAILARFPDTPWSETELPVQRQVLTAWREWQDLEGDERKLAEIGNFLGRATELKRAATSVIDAAALMRAHAGLQRQLAQVPPPGFVERAQATIDQLRRGTALLPEQTAAGFDRQLGRLAAALRGELTPGRRPGCRRRWAGSAPWWTMRCGPGWWQNASGRWRGRGATTPEP
ncbi:hypothetical protein JYK14_04490 [Siccirubricoccus sp. KC 17139]|uniref:Uncharacterized protein n=1 Tax=Siccirubricoccus soli TaxID=2899147 RepID=A0ABT1D0I7_9PROT|nr:hypothetical protein [Siccirubricoccus soli]MCO6415436.1 hypothetical protein [Siccirubricoccus soli]MCP2681568.1 hypothetical protein [Siccirubricoccus soli]